MKVTEQDVSIQGKVRVRVRKLSLNASVLAYPMKPVCSLGQMRKNESNEQNGDTQQSWLCYLPY